MRAEPGLPYPLGATWDAHGVNFALFAEHATAVDLCLFDSPEALVESHRVPLLERTDLVWHGYVRGISPGQLYGYRVDGPWRPAVGHFFNATKVLFDPYSRLLGRAPAKHPSLLAENLDDNDEGRPPSLEDNAAFAPLSAVVDVRFDWAGDAAPRTAWHKTVIYEAHVKGFTARHPEIPPALRGTYLGLAAPAVIDHLRRLGVTAVELLPIHQHLDEWPLIDRGLTNYWGYNTIGFFAPDLRFVSPAVPLSPVAQVQTMVAALHAAGIEVILDVVYNHTAEGGPEGPTYAMRGLDNRRYYRLDPARPSRYEDFSGCGNTLDTSSPAVLQLMLDSLRYWVDVMHIDGFRFDLAPALARGHHGVDRLELVFETIRRDPVLAPVKLIAEPWDAREGGMQLGGFPPGWSEWNGRYRDGVRRYWRGDRGVLPELATRLSGSSDLFGQRDRRPQASLNFVTAHDGFTLADLVAYQDKHNAANGEENRDGEQNNYSWNCGVEGPTDDRAILALRRRQRRNFLVTLFMSLGVPMLNGGDEMNRTQEGNNNAYCQDSPLTWTPWDLEDDDRAAEVAFVAALSALRARTPALQRRTFLTDTEAGRAEVLWLTPEGLSMTSDHWAELDRRALGVLFAAQEPAPGSQTPTPDLLVLLNASNAEVVFTLPAAENGAAWSCVIDTALPSGLATASADAAPHTTATLVAHSAMVLVSQGHSALSS